MKTQVPLTPILAVVLVIVAAVGWFALLAPKQSKSAELDGGIAELQTKLATAVRTEKPAAQPSIRIDVADVFRLAKAMPDREEMPGMILELNSVALSAGVRFVAMQPTPPVQRGPYYSTPVTLTLEGNYYDLTDFLFRLRNLVSVRDGVLAASGRLYALDAVDLHEAPEGFPHIQAVLTLSAYSFGTVPLAPGVAPPAAPPAAAPPPAAPSAAPPATTESTSTEPPPPMTTEGTTTPTPPAPPPPPGVGDQQAAGGTG